METRSVLKNFILSELVSDSDIKAIDDSDLLLESGIIDSFGILSLMTFLEQKFSVAVAGEDLMPENFKSVEAISSFIESKRAS
jgi:acyl carrier protein